MLQADASLIAVSQLAPRPGTAPTHRPRRHPNQPGSSAHQAESSAHQAGSSPTQPNQPCLAEVEASDADAAAVVAAGGGAGADAAVVGSSAGQTRREAGAAGAAGGHATCTGDRPAASRTAASGGITADAVVAGAAEKRGEQGESSDSGTRRHSAAPSGDQGEEEESRTPVSSDRSQEAGNWRGTAWCGGAAPPLQSRHTLPHSGNWVRLSARQQHAAQPRKPWPAKAEPEECGTFGREPRQSASRRWAHQTEAGLPFTRRGPPGAHAAAYDAAAYDAAAGTRSAEADLPGSFLPLQMFASKLTVRPSARDPRRYDLRRCGQPRAAPAGGCADGPCAGKGAGQCGVVATGLAAKVNALGSLMGVAEAGASGGEEQESREDRREGATPIQPATPRLDSGPRGGGLVVSVEKHPGEDQVS